MTVTLAKTVWNVNYTRGLPWEVEKPLRNDESARIEQIGGWQHRPDHDGSAP